MLLAATSVRGNIVSSATLTLRMTFLPNMGLANGSSSEESNLVKSASRSESSSGLRFRAGPGLVASPTRTPRNPHRELINSEWPKRNLQLASNHSVSLVRRSNLTQAQNGIPHPWAHRGCDPTTPTEQPLVGPNLQFWPPTRHLRTPSRSRVRNCDH